MNRIRTLIVDDQPMARGRLANLLAQEEDVEVVGECNDSAQAVAAIRQLEPDLVFLDIQIPEAGGLRVVEQVGEDRMPTVIFVTAYDQYALRAFEVHALDYLLKPFGRERFQKALDHARRHLQRERDGALARRLVSMVSELRQPAPSPPDRLLVKSGARMLFLSVGDVDWVKAEGNYARLHVGSESHLIRETMTSLEARLGSARFARIHRSLIARLELIKELQLSRDGDYDAVLRNGMRLRVGRAFREALQERLKKG